MKIQKFKHFDENLDEFNKEDVLESSIELISSILIITLPFELPNDKYDLFESKLKNYEDIKNITTTLDRIYSKKTLRLEIDNEYTNNDEVIYILNGIFEKI